MVVQGHSMSSKLVFAGRSVTRDIIGVTDIGLR